jgi:hypothetical protein
MRAIEILRDTEVDAPADVVWGVLVDLPAFRTWNPFIRSARGRVAPGGVLRLRVRTTFGVPLMFRATILGCEVNRELRWRGEVIGPWLASGEHWFTIEPLGPGRVRFVQGERFGGLLPRLARELLVREAGWGFDAMNRELKRRAEREAGITPRVRAAG